MFSSCSSVYSQSPKYTPDCRAVQVLSCLLPRTPLTVTRSRGRTARLTCALDVDISGATVHWYLHTDGEAPTHLLYVGSTGEAQYSEDEHKAKYRAEKTPLERKLEERDVAVYYCAAWDFHDDCHLGALRTKTTRR
uniref:Ig-like domain-containing protein n=1 Tax=Erpetoichthys calabaricus TaxID=27687 RepID=A0A8C4T2Z5_ERPCA